MMMTMMMTMTMMMMMRMRMMTMMLAALGAGAGESDAAEPWRPRPGNCGLRPVGREGERAGVTEVGADNSSTRRDGTLLDRIWYYYHYYHYYYYCSSGHSRIQWFWQPAGST
jgi:hypothetical protein